MACAQKSDPTCSPTQSLPIHYKSFHLPYSLTTSNPSKQLISLSLSDLRVGYKLLTLQRSGLMSVTGFQFCDAA